MDFEGISLVGSPDGVCEQIKQMLKLNAFLISEGCLSFRFPKVVDQWQALNNPYITSAIVKIKDAVKVMQQNFEKQLAKEFQVANLRDALEFKELKSSKEDDNLLMRILEKSSAILPEAFISFIVDEFVMDVENNSFRGEITEDQLFSYLEFFEKNPTAISPTKLHPAFSYVLLQGILQGHWDRIEPFYESMSYDDRIHFDAFCNENLITSFDQGGSAWVHALKISGTHDAVLEELKRCIAMCDVKNPRVLRLLRFLDSHDDTDCICYLFKDEALVHSSVPIDDILASCKTKAVRRIVERHLKSGR
jgi:hypothetical protein